MALTLARLKELLEYSPETGVFTWLVNRSRTAKAGQVAGTVSVDGYICICIDGRVHKAHRLALFWVFGEWPPEQTDHINGIRRDNRISNLRQATHAQNQQNQKRVARNSSGYKGVYWNKSLKKWHAQIHANNKRAHIGFFTTAEEGHAAYMAAAREHFGEFARNA